MSKEPIMVNEMMELLPCPFCGETPTLVEAVFDSHDDYVYCHNCEVTGPAAIDGVMASFKTPAEAIAAWNRRPSLVQREPSEGEVAEVLLFASYCGGGNPECSPQRPCPLCLGMSNVFAVPRNTLGEYKRQLAPDWNGIEALTSPQSLRAAYSLREQVEPVRQADEALCRERGMEQWQKSLKRPDLSEQDRVRGAIDAAMNQACALRLLDTASPPDDTVRDRVIADVPDEDVRRVGDVMLAVVDAPELEVYRAARVALAQLRRPT